MIGSSKLFPKTKSFEAFVRACSVELGTTKKKPVSLYCRGLRVAQGLRSCGRKAQIREAHIALLLLHTQPAIPVCKMQQVLDGWRRASLGLPHAGNRGFMDDLSLVALSWACPERFKVQNSSLSNQHAARLRSGDMVRSPATRLWLR